PPRRALDKVLERAWRLPCWKACFVALARASLRTEPVQASRRNLAVPADHPGFGAHPGSPTVPPLSGPSSSSGCSPLSVVRLAMTLNYGRSRNPATSASAREPRDPLRIPHPAGGLESAAKSSHCHALILSIWTPERNRPVTFL